MQVGSGRELKAVSDGLDGTIGRQQERRTCPSLTERELPEACPHRLGEERREPGPTQPTQRGRLFQRDSSLLPTGQVQGGVVCERLRGNVAAHRRGHYLLPVQGEVPEAAEQMHGERGRPSGGSSCIPAPSSFPRSAWPCAGAWQHSRAILGGSGEKGLPGHLGMVL